MRSQSRQTVGWGVVAVSTVLKFGGIFVTASVLQALWAWFIPPATGFAPLSFPQSLGLIFIVALFDFRWDGKIESGKDDDEEELNDMRRRMARVVYVLLIFGLGAIVHFVGG